tara:strand:- start:21721 stop:22308 length:588 start_codon:yes stop_codon:yes gene_type:complete
MSQALPTAQDGNYALIALGSNAATAMVTAREAVLKGMIRSGLALGGIPVKSELYATPAFPAGAGPDFVNAVIRVQTDMDADAIMAALHVIEAEAGRTRSVRWGQRTLDLDLIGLGGQVLPDKKTHQFWRDLPPAQQIKSTPDQLIVPHPRMQDRSFVLVPLADVAPDWVHPVLELTVTQMRDARPEVERASVKLI